MSQGLNWFRVLLCEGLPSGRDQSMEDSLGFLSGIDMAATEAAGEPEFGATVAKLLQPRAGQPPAPYIEMILEAKVTAGTSGGAKIIGYRRIEDPRPAR